ncbi:MAG: 30S ribosomal protein S1, partial [Flavobacteriaceae bacterium]|nr:30S ribosomal protein S1 [Flavobacteriaceae bacterium]
MEYKYLSAMAEENNTPQEANEQAAPQEAQAQPTANNAEDFLSNFNWHNYEEGIDVIEDAQLLEFETLVKENFVDTADEDVIDGTVV